MRPDIENSVYHEVDNVEAEFTFDEVRKCRFILRKLRFLETKMNRTKNKASDDAMYAALEIEGLEWLLTEVGFLKERKV